MLSNNEAVAGAVRGSEQCARPHADPQTGCFACALPAVDNERGHWRVGGAAIAAGSVRAA